MEVLKTFYPTAEQLNSIMPDSYYQGLKFFHLMKNNSILADVLHQDGVWRKIQMSISDFEYHFKINMVDLLIK